MLAETSHGSRTHATYGEGADAVGTAHIEHLAVGHPVAVAIRPYIARIDVSHEVRRAVQSPRLGEVGLKLQELRVGVLEEFFVLLVPVVACEKVE